MKTAVRLGAIMALGSALSLCAYAEDLSDEQVRRILPDLNQHRQFDKSEAIIMEFFSETPGSADVLYSYLKDLEENYDEHERVIRIATKLLPKVAKEGPEWTGRILKCRALAIVFGRYSQSRDPKDLALAKEDFAASIRYNDRISESWEHLAMIASIYGDIEVTKVCLLKAFQTSNDPEMKARLASLWSVAERDPKRFLGLAKNFYFKRTK